MAVGDKLVTLDGLKAVYQDLNGNTNDLKSQIDGQTEIPATDAGFYKCNKDTYYMDENLTTNLTAYKHAKIACNPGDVFVVSGTSPSNATAVRTYAFVDENRFSLARSAIGETLENRMITAPVGTVWLYITNYQNTATVKKGKPITMRVDDTKNTVSSYLFRSISSEAFGVTWTEGGFNANSGQVNSETTIRSNEEIDAGELLLRRVYVTDKNYKLKLFAWNKTTKAFAGVWNGTEIVTYNAYVLVEHAEINTSTLGNYMVRFVLQKTDGTAVSVSDASVVRFEVPLYQQAVNESEQPQNYQGKEFSVFDKVLCIGDSLMKGGANEPSGIQPSQVSKRTVAEGTYSIPKFLEKMYGVQTVNWGHSGKTSMGWYTTYSTGQYESWEGFDAALIYLGSNDHTYCDDPEGDQLSIEDGVDRSEEYIGLIIAKLKQDNPGIRIFLCTLNPYVANGNLAQYRLPLIERIEQIAENDDSVFLVDLFNYGTMTAHSPYHNGHPTAIGYQLMAKEIGSIASYIISRNPDKFRWIRWIGTEYAVTDNVTPGSDSDDIIG